MFFALMSISRPPIMVERAVALLGAITSTYLCCIIIFSGFHIDFFLCVDIRIYVDPNAIVCMLFFSI